MQLEADLYARGRRGHEEKENSMDTLSALYTMTQEAETPIKEAEAEDQEKT